MEKCLTCGPRKPTDRLTAKQIHGQKYRVTGRQRDEGTKIQRGKDKNEIDDKNTQYQDRQTDRHMETQTHTRIETHRYTDTQMKRTQIHKYVGIVGQIRRHKDT